MKYTNSVKQAILYSALTHITILIIISIKERDIDTLNYFKILQLDYFFPQLLQLPYSTAISLTIFAGVCLLLFVKQNKHS